MKRTFLLCIVVCLFGAFAQAQQSLHFIFHYTFRVQNVPVGEPLRVWIPEAQSDAYQQVRVVQISSEIPLRQTREPEYGDKMFYGATDRARRSDYSVAITYDVVRREHKFVATSAAVHPLSNAERMRDLAPDRLVPVSGLPAELAQKQTAGMGSEMQKARALYDYVFNNMRYDKSGTGWGRGDVLYACNAKHGNCTDFHSLFISMARSQNIPARFEIGFQIPEKAAAGEIPGYHCWAEFFADGQGWVPVDISEAWLTPTRRDYYFGAHDAYRVQFSSGRDLRLAPAQDGPALNYFVYPYVEVAHKSFANVNNHFWFKDAAAERPPERRATAAQSQPYSGSMR